MRLGDAYMHVNWGIISSDNGLAPIRCQAIIWTNVEPMLNDSQLDPLVQISAKSEPNSEISWPQPHNAVWQKSTI